MFFDGTLGHTHDLGDLGIGATVNAVEQKNMPRALGQAAQGRLDLAQVITGFQGGLGLTAVGVGFGLPVMADPLARAFAAQMVDGDIARTAQQIGAQLFNLHQWPPPKTQKQILHQIGSRGPATHAAAHQRFHLRTLGQKHLQKMRSSLARFTVGAILEFGWGHGDRCAGQKESDTNDKYSHMQKQMTGCVTTIDKW